MYRQVWNHPWVLKLGEIREAEKAEREAMYGLSDEDETLGGFIVSEGSDVEREQKRTTSQNMVTLNISANQSIIIRAIELRECSFEIERLFRDTLVWDKVTMCQ